MTLANVGAILYAEETAMSIHHIFVINPTSGKGSDKQPLIDAIEARKGTYNADYYITTCPFDATRYVREYCEQHPEEEVYFYACGGDGTLNEVASGVVGHPHAAVAVYPCGSGNDYLKYYGTKEDFLDLDRLMEGTAVDVDIMQVGDRYALNACHFGFDSYVAAKIHEYRHTKKNPYMSAVLYTLVHGMRNHAKVVCDGETYLDGEYLICTICNGAYVGGGYKVAPYSNNHDGLLEVTKIKTTSRINFLSKMGLYKTGEYLDNPKFKNLAFHRTAKEVHITVPEGFGVSLDGEMIYQTEIDVKNIEKGIRFVVPKGLEIK